MARRELHGFGAVGVLDHELTAVVFLGVGEEKRGGEIGAETLAGPGYDADGAIDVRAERLAAGVAVEHWRQNVQRERGGEKKRIGVERLENERAELLGDRMIDGK